MKLLVLDGNSILNRAFYGIKLLTTKNGHYTNAVYGFMTMFQHLLDETHPDAVACAFDVKAPTFRHRAYSGYKAQRKGMPPELAEQLPEVQQLLRLLGYGIVTCEGFEADDILGTLARGCREAHWDCVIATGDRDSLQLVGGGVQVRITATKMGRPEVTLYDEAKIRETCGVAPHQLIDIKALQGDTSDNIPGVAGIGPKGAGELIRKFGDLDTIYNQLDTIDIRDSLRAKLAAGRDSAYMSRMLGTIRTDAPIDASPDAYRRGEPHYADAAALLRELECFNLIDRLGLRALADAQAAESAAPEAAAAAVSVTRCGDFDALLNEVRADGAAAAMLPAADGAVGTLIVAHGGRLTVCDPAADGFAAFARALLTDPDIALTVHDSKPVYAAICRAGWDRPGTLFDTALAAYLLNPSAAGYDPLRLAEQAGIAVPAVECDFADTGALKAAAVLPALAEKLRAEIDANGQAPLLRDIEQPLAQVLAEMEIAGMAVDCDGIAQYGTLLQLQIDMLQNRIYAQAGCEFNINSPKQLGEVLFEKLQLPGGKKTKTGYSTNADVLEGLQAESPVVHDILEYRTLAKLKSTYCDGLTRVVGADGRIHSSFNQTETRTGRISSTEPNLQNIPVRTDAGRELRRYFRAADGCTLIDADYSQIELRVLAHVADDEAMIDAFRTGQDIHRITASQVFHLPPELITPILRSRAKAVNFGIVYGIGAFSLAKDIHVSRAEAGQYIRDYLAHYTGVDAYMTRVVAQARTDGYAQDLFGRRRYLPELASSNFNLRSFGERVARNMPIQGAAADIIKIAMIRVRDRLRAEGLRARLILQVHDELIVEAPESEAVRAADILKEEMEHAVALRVPMTVDIHMGKTWYDAKG